VVLKKEEYLNYQRREMQTNEGDADPKSEGAMME